MGARENKENAIWSESSVPVTPTHLLSRSQSFMKNISPKRAEQRKPLASKDNNKSTGFLGAKEPLRKRTRPTVNHAGSFIGNTRPGVVPILNTNGAPRIKSLVLKDDIEEEQSQSDGGEAEDDESNSLAAKLRGKLNARDRDDSTEQGGLLGATGGLQGLANTKLHSDTLDSDSDLEVEVIPPRPEPLPHIPHGYTPFTDEDIGKLQDTGASPFQLNFADDDDDASSQDSTQLFTLKLDNDDDLGDQEHDRKRLHTPEKKPTRASIAQQAADFELDPIYAGHGLSTKELESLLE